MNREKTIYETDEIKAVFTYLKTEKNIVNITEAGSVSTIYTDSLKLLRSNYDVYLQTGQIVTINNINYQVNNVNLTAKTFQITKTGLFHMSTDLIPTIVLDATKWNLAIDFKYGTRIEINEILEHEVSDPYKKLQRFPLVWLIINDNNKRIHDTLDFDLKTNILMYFVHISKPEYRADYRETNIFKPILDPLKLLFIETLQSTYFANKFNFKDRRMIYNDDFLYFFGSADKDKMVFNAPTDAIELSFELEFRKQYI